jgi:hypothetical protein
MKQARNSSNFVLCLLEYFSIVSFVLVCVVIHCSTLLLLCSLPANIVL